MPDANKMAALERAGYTIRPCCGLCRHGEFPPTQDWSTCPLIPYKHEKHTARGLGLRAASIHRTGLCKHFEKDEAQTALLGAHARFMEEDHHG